MRASALKFAAPALSFVLALILTPTIRALARRWGFIAQPKTDRWHKKSTATLGGVAIWLTVVTIYLLFVPHTSQGWVVIGTATFLFLVGLVDDLIHIKPYQKLIGQVMGASLVVYYGLALPWTRSSPTNMVITIFWLIGITNALNLLDNMDGLAAGTAAIASVFLIVSFLAGSQPTDALMLSVFAASFRGFLVYNSTPASIFMGDCGSIFVCFFLAIPALVNVTVRRSRTFFPLVPFP